MLKHGEINPLNVFGIRKMEHCPPHFEKIVFQLRTSEKKILDWVYENLESRFWMGDSYSNFDDKLHLSKCIAFESPSEASYFLLLIDQINSWEIR